MLNMFYVYILDNLAASESSLQQPANPDFFKAAVHFLKYNVTFQPFNLNWILALVQVYPGKKPNCIFRVCFNVSILYLQSEI